MQTYKHLFKGTIFINFKRQGKTYKWYSCTISEAKYHRIVGVLFHRSSTTSVKPNYIFIVVSYEKKCERYGATARTGMGQLHLVRFGLVRTISWCQMTWLKLQMGERIRPKLKKCIVLHRFVGQGRLNAGLQTFIGGPTKGVVSSPLAGRVMEKVLAGRGLRTEANRNTR